MFVVRSLLAALIIGPLAVPAHWCCALEVYAKPCCRAVQVETEKPAPPCCGAAQRYETTAVVQSSHTSPDARPCCCRATTEPTIPTAKPATSPDDVPAVLDVLAFHRAPTTSIVVVRDSCSTPPLEPTQARLCRWRC